MHGSGDRSFPEAVVNLNADGVRDVFANILGASLHRPGRLALEMLKFVDDVEANCADAACTMPSCSMCSMPFIAHHQASLLHSSVPGLNVMGLRSRVIFGMLPGRESRFGPVWDARRSSVVC